MIVDFHTHVFSPAIKEDRALYVSRDPCFAMLYSNPRARLATAEELVDSMDRDGVAVSVIANIGWTTQELCNETNDYIMDAVARYPKRLIGFGAVQPTAGQAAIAEIERCARGGIRGIGEMRPDVQTFSYADRALLAPLVSAMIRLGLVFLTHASEPVGHDYPGKGGITPGFLYPLVTAFPELQIVCAHWGGGLPFYALMPEVKRAMANVFFDTAASPFLYSPQVYSQVIELAGEDRVLFGSDYPLLSQGRVIREIRSLHLPPETEKLVLSGNARRLLGINTGG